MLKPAQWDERYQQTDTPWDLGGTTPALIEWCRTQDLKRARVLVPGCGGGHDAHFLSLRSKKVFGLDYAQKALDRAQQNYPDSRTQWVQADATTMTFDEPLDLVWEYTCFCALMPELREAYVRQVAEVLRPGGRFVGLTFLKVPNPEDGPPFQIEPEALRTMLSQHFEILEFESETDRSIKARKGTEIWFVGKKS